MKKLFCLIYYIFSTAQASFGYDFYFTRIDGKNGLSHNNVKAILQDSYGFMWFGTRNRLNRYDGVSLEQFDCYDPKTGRRNNNVSALYEDVRKNLWVGTDRGVFRFDPLKETFTFFADTARSGAAVTDWIADIRSDPEGNIWIVAPNQGVFKYMPGAGKAPRLHHYTVVDELRPNVSAPQCITIEKNGKVWIGTLGCGVYLYDKAADTFIQYLGDAEGNRYLAGKNIYTLSHDADDLLVGVHEEKLMKLDKRRNILSDFDTDAVNYQIIRDIRVWDEGEVWVATESGVYVADRKKRTVVHAGADPLDAHALPDKATEKIYRDRNGGIWIGTEFGGVSYLPGRTDRFEKYYPTDNPAGIPSKRIREIREDDSGTLWIGTEDAGLLAFDPAAGTFRKMGRTATPKALAVLVRPGEVWTGYFKNGLEKIHPSTGRTVHYSGSELGLDEASVCALCEDRYGRIWLGNAWGVFVQEKGEAEFRRMDSFGLSYAFDIIEDSDGYIWVATIGNGVFEYRPADGELFHYLPGGENTISSNTVSSITEDHAGHIWFSTDRGGISRYDKESRTFRNYGTADGLPDDIAYKILEDKEYNLWFGTNQGLVRFNPANGAVRVFTQNDGLLSDQYNYKSGLVSRASGKLYFGCIEGLIAFDPAAFREDPAAPPVYITRFQIANEEAVPGAPGSPLEHSILHTDKIRLKHNQSSIGFQFVALNYTTPGSNQYAYKMENVDEDWIVTRHNRSASYAKLPPGKYVFRVRASNNDGVWTSTDRALSIEILPPWWASPAAYAGYLLISAALAGGAFRYSLAKYRRRNREKQRLFEMQKEKELYETKVEFFTNIAHEIRTPVTLINGPLEAVLTAGIDDKKVKRNLEIIEKNTQHLSNLIDRLLDFRKVDSDRFPVNLQKTDIVALTHGVCKRFEGQLAAGNKEFRLVTSVPGRYMVTDREALTRMLDNLLSNAVKYSDRLVEMQVDADESYLTVRLTNDGEPVAEALREKIFEPFFRIPSPGRELPGSGIGLPLARSLAERLGGYLQYEASGEANRFVLKIPAGPAATDAAGALAEEPAPDGSPAAGTGKETGQPVVLIAEDHPDMLEFVAGLLNDRFRIVKAADGAEAQQAIRTRRIDILVSDVMMPRCDGFDLCRFVKTSPEYNRILVVLLTARNDLAAKIKGLEAGADAYVEKPFSPHYLHTLIVSLHANRQRELELWMQNPSLPFSQPGMSKGDEEFLEKATGIIREHIADPDFSVESLADALLLSRSSLHRRIKALTERSPIELIRLIRLQKAAELIREGKYRINEICYLVGMNTPSYFIKTFQQHYGMTPKEYEVQSKS